MNKQNYVLGFAFNVFYSEVVLIEKLKPEWQKGFLNGVGGKIEVNESSLEAIIREFEEETGVKSNNEDWRYVANLNGEDFSMYVYCSNSIDIRKVKTVEEEIVRVVDLPINNHNVIYNLNWLIPMCIDSEVSCSQVFIK